MIKSSAQGAVQVIAVEGPLSAEEVARFEEAVQATPLVGRPQLVIDFADSPLIDSAGCETLLDARDEIVAAGGAVHLAALSPLCRDILNATGVIRYFQVFENVKQAVGQFSR